MASSGSTIAAGLEDGGILWKTTGDQAWRTVATNPQSTAWDIVLDPVDPSIGYYTLGTEPTRVFATSDGAKTWKLLVPPINGFAQALAIRPADRALLVAGQGMFLASTDSGATWKASNAPWDTRRLFILPNSTSLVLGSDHGLHWTDDGGKTWLDLTGSISSTILYSVAVNGNTILTSSQDFGPFVSLDAGKTWGNPTGPLAEGGAISINPGDPKYCYAFTISGFATSKNGCSTFTAVRGPTWKGFDRASSQNLITVDPRNPATIYVGAYDGVWSSSDFGQTLTKLTWPIQQVSNVVLDPQDPMAIYVCANAGLYQSLDGGLSWKKLSLPTPYPIPNAATVSPTDSNLILVALVDGAGRSPGGILRSTDRGASFAFSNQGLSTVNFNLGVDQQAIAFNPAPAAGTLPVVALATTGGLYASADLGTTWMNVSANAIPRVFSFVHWSQGYLWASTYGQGVLRSDQPVTASLLSPPLAVSGSPISLTYIQGLSPTSGSQTLQITTVGVAQSFTVAINQGSGVCGNWLSASPLTGTTGNSASIPITVSYNFGGLPANTNAICDGTVTVTSAGVTVTIPVAIQIMPVSQTRSQQWNLASTQSSLGLSSMNMVFDSNRKSAVMFGGRNWPANTTVSSNTYQYTPTGWNQISTPNSPPGRFWSAMAYDDHRQRIVLFGGQNNSSTFDDTWEFNGTNWTPVSTAHSPDAQSGTSMIYDSCRQKTLLFDNRGKTWEFNGVDWTNVTTATSPPARNLAAMVFDPGHCRALLFGGGAGTLGLSDTWSYDGSNWTQLSTATSPPGRWAHAMAFDSARGKIVLFGGYGPAYPAGSDRNDTWEFDGTTWVQVLSQSSPPPTEQAAITYDQSRNRMVMFGGWGNPTQNWEYMAGPVWAVTTTHVGTFSQGQTGATYTVSVSNVWTAPTTGAITLAETIPPGLSLVSMSGAGWTCASGASTCTRSDSLAANATYPPVNVIVNIAVDAPPWATNFVTVSGAGLTTGAATDLTPIIAAGPQISIAGIVNAATSQPGGIAPNEFISLIGTGLGPATGVGSAMTLQLAGTSVSIGGTPAYLTFASNQQINVLVPFGVSRSPSTTIQVRYNGVAGNTVTVPVVESAPGIFTQQYGPGQVWMVNQDGTINSSSNPAARNSYVTFWVTGQGAVDMPPPDGTQPTGPPYPTPVLPVSVSLGGVAVSTANVVFEGLVYSGEMQINLLIPTDAPSGNAVPLVVSVGSASSRPDATIAIR